MQQHESATFFNAFLNLLRRINNFLESLPLPSQMEGSASANADIILTHSIAQVAIIKMHSLFASANTSSKDASITAAKAVLRMVKDADNLRAACVNPIMPVSILYLPPLKY
jgi:hypothetical protein